jgi:murein L,D-transpeptidase YafK
LYRGEVLLKSYCVSLGSQPRGAKEVEGDGRTPEGSYFISNRNPHSGFHRALQISYPSASDTARARAIGKEPGGEIMIHGLRNGLGWLGRWHRLWDWTAGCVALTNAEMDELWRAVPTGTPVQIKP